MLSVGFRFVLCDVDGPQKKEKEDDMVFSPFTTPETPWVDHSVIDRANPWITPQDNDGTGGIPDYINQPRWVNDNNTTPYNDTNITYNDIDGITDTDYAESNGQAFPNEQKLHVKTMTYTYIR